MLIALSATSFGQYKNVGDFCNIVVFISFAGDSVFTEPFSTYQNIFSDTAGPSLTDYYKECSFGKFNIINHFYPAPQGEQIRTYIDKKPRGYYFRQTLTNPDGYLDSSDCASRKISLLANCCKFIEKKIPQSVNLDMDSNNSIDNITFVLLGGTESQDGIFWPHHTLSEINYMLNGKYVQRYLLIPSEVLTLGVLCHEFFHALGAPDLYHIGTSNMTPVYFWDLMEYKLEPPQSMSAYMKYQYGHWIDSIPFISTPKRYALDPVNSKKANAYFVKSKKSDEMFCLEYRRACGKYESSLSQILDKDLGTPINFSGGMLIYRINSLYAGKGNFHADYGVPDEIYLYRPNGSKYNNGKPWLAPFNTKYKRGEFSPKTNPAPMLFDSTMDSLRISNIIEQDSVLYFTLHSNIATFIKEPANSDIGVSVTPKIVWDEVPGNKTYKIQLSTRSNFTTINYEGTAVNDSVHYITDTLSPEQIYYVRVGIMGTHSQVQKWSESVNFTTASNIHIATMLKYMCSGRSYEVELAALQAVPANTNYSILLSNKNGNFDTSIIVGATNSNYFNNNKATAIIHIPDTIPTGYFYAVKLISSSLFDNFSIIRDIQINGIPTGNFVDTDTNVCYGTTTLVRFKPDTNGVKDAWYEYKWYVNGGNILSSTDSTALIHWSSEGSAVVSVFGSNIDGCNSIITKNFTVYSKPNIIFRGPTNVCPYMPIRYYCPDVASQLTDITIDSGEWERISKDSIIVVFARKPVCNIIVIRKNASGCLDTLTYPVNIIVAPDFNIVNVLDKSDFCEGDTAYFKPSFIDTLIYTYTWQVVGADFTLGSNHAEIVVLCDEPNSPIFVSLIMKNKKTGCEVTLNDTIFVHPRPDKPTIKYIDNYLVSSVTANSYRWYFDDVFYSSAEKIIPEYEGRYFVTIKNEFGCANTSDLYQYVSISEQEDTGRCFYANDNVTIIANTESMQVDIFDLLGQKILSQHFDARKIINIPLRTDAKIIFVRVSYNSSIRLFPIVVR